MAWGLPWRHSDGLQSGSVFHPCLEPLIGETLHMFAGNGASRVSLLLAWIFKRTKLSKQCRFSFRDSCGNSPQK